MADVSTDKKEIVDKFFTRTAIVSAICFFGGILLIPFLIGLVMLPLGILGFIWLILIPFVLPKRIKSYNCPHCSTEIFWLANKTEKGLNCPACLNRLLINENRLVKIGEKIEELPVKNKKERKLWVVEKLKKILNKKEVNQQQENKIKTENNIKHKKSIWKKWWFWVIAALGIILIYELFIRAIKENRIDMIFFLLSLLAFVILIIGLIKPTLVIRWGENKNRKKVVLIYGIITLVLFIFAVVTSPVSEKTPQSQQIIEGKKEELLLTILEPQNNTEVILSKIIIKGRTDTGARVIIQGKEVTVDENGNFKQIVELSMGKNTFEIVAEKEEKQKRITLNITRKAVEITSSKPIEVTPPKKTSLSIGDEGFLKVGDDPNNIVFIATDLDAFDELMKIIRAKDAYGLLELGMQGKAFGVTNGTKVKIIDTAMGKRRVRIIQGVKPIDEDKVGLSGWIPKEWVVPQF